MEDAYRGYFPKTEEDYLGVIQSLLSRWCKQESLDASLVKALHPHRYLYSDPVTGIDVEVSSRDTFVLDDYDWFTFWEVSKHGVLTVKGHN